MVLLRVIRVLASNSVQIKWAPKTIILTFTEKAVESSMSKTSTNYNLLMIPINIWSVSITTSKSVYCDMWQWLHLFTTNSNRQEFAAQFGITIYLNNSRFNVNFTHKPRFIFSQGEGLKMRLRRSWLRLKINCLISKNLWKFCWTALNG